MRRLSSPCWHDQICGWIALVAPVVAGLWSASGWVRWQDDLAVVRDLGVVPVGGEGVLSMVLAQLASLLPVGGRLLRATWVSAAALGISGRLIYSLLRQLLTRSACPTSHPSWVNSLVALLAVGIFVVSPTAQGEANRIGGALIALGLLLMGLRLIEQARAAQDARVFPLLGLVVGLAATENHGLGLALLSMSLLTGLVSRRARSMAACLHFLAGLVFAAAMGCCVAWLRPLSPNAWLDLGVGALGVPSQGVPSPVSGVMQWFGLLGQSADQAMGAGVAVLGGLGAIVSLVRPAVVGRHFAPLMLIAFGSLSPLLAAEGFDREAKLTTLALSTGLIVQAALLALAGFSALARARLPYAQPVAPLALVMGLILVLRGVDKLPSPTSEDNSGAEAWVEEALGKLPSGSLLLVRHEESAYRLLASRVLYHSRPDVISVPEALLSRGSVASDLLEMEPELSSLLRQLAVHGFADEYSLSRLADARPLYVELDPKWNDRLLDHVRPEAMWLGFSAHALGSSDRVAGLARSQAAFERVVATAARQQFDDTTLSVLAGVAEQQALVLAGLGDRKGANAALEILKRLDPQHSLLAQLQERLSKRGRGRVAVADLID